MWTFNCAVHFAHPAAVRRSTQRGGCFGRIVIGPGSRGGPCRKISSHDLGRGLKNPLDKKKSKGWAITRPCPHIRTSLDGQHFIANPSVELDEAAGKRSVKKSGFRANTSHDDEFLVLW